MTASQPGDIFQPGDLLNNTYRIVEILGRGGTSEVYKARSEISGKVMAVKALRAEFASNEDFLVLMTREEDIRDIRHDAIVRYFDTQRMPDGVVYLVMDYVEGPGLDRKLAEGGMPASELMVVGRRVTEGLIAAHERNIVHRDLSPDNIILRGDRPEEAVIIDFGIAKDTNPGAETIVGNEFAGKYAYAAPEQLSGRTDPRSDIYSLGALLLATFRGRKPDPGRNPMEVVQNKGKPLELRGVPDPLRSILARMTDPDPARRFGTARELLEAFQNPDAASHAPSPAPALDDATVIVPAAARPEATLGIPDARPAPKPAPEPAKGKGGFVAVIAVIALAALGAGAWFAGLFGGLTGPAYPVADPFVLTVEKGFDGMGRATGNVPSEDMQAALAGRVAEARLQLASGDLPDGWDGAVLETLDRLEGLEEYSLSLSGGAATVTGLAATPTDLESVEAAFASGLPAPLSGATDFSLGPRFVTAAALEPILEANADCGRLTLMSPPPVGYGLEDRIIVTGRFADEATRARLQGDIAALAGDRPVRIEGETLNPALCQIDAILPRAAPGGFELRFGWGDRAGDNPSGTYKVGENPVIDLKLPETVTDGYLWVSVVDVKGIVFHLMPNRLRPDNSVAGLRAESGDGTVRLAYGLDEAQGTGKLAFTVDGSVLGKSKILVLHSDRPLFDDLRPTTESAASYAEAISEARDNGGLRITSLDSAILTTEE